MPTSSMQGDADQDGIDHAALRMMLRYIEAECRRIGANEAARHAAMAAALMSGTAMPIARGARGAGIH